MLQKIGLAMLAGGLICKFVVEPGVAKLKKNGRRTRGEKSCQ